MPKPLRCLIVGENPGDVIRRFGAALHASYGQTMTAAQKADLSALGRCRTAALGGHLYRCDRCGARARGLQQLPKPALPPVPRAQERRTHPMAECVVLIDRLVPER